MNQKFLELHNKLHIEPTEDTKLQFLRSLYAGVAATSVDILVLFLLTHYFHVYYLISAIFGFLSGLAVIYTISIKWIFNKHSLKNRKLEFSIFLVISLVGLILLEFFMWLFTDFFGVYYLFSKILATLLVFTWNFLARKFLLFSSK